MSRLTAASWFFLEAQNFKNFRFDAEVADMVTMVIWALAAGLALAALLTLYQRHVPGSFIRALLRAGADSEETALTLAELGFEKNSFVRLELKYGTLLRKHLRIAQQKSENEGDTVKSDPRTDRFYIPEELKYRAEAHYDKKGNGPVQCILTIGLSVIIAVLLIRLIPLLLSFVDAIL